MHSLLLATVILTAFLAAPCVACADQPMKGHDCCNSRSHCPPPVSKTLHVECGTPALQSFVVEADHTPAPLLVVAAQPITDQPVIAVLRAEPPERSPYSPPDLCLLNSVLTI